MVGYVLYSLSKFWVNIMTVFKQKFYPRPQDLWKYRFPEAMGYLPVMFPFQKVFWITLIKFTGFEFYVDPSIWHCWHCHWSQTDCIALLGHRDSCFLVSGTRKLPQSHSPWTFTCNKGRVFYLSSCVWLRKQGQYPSIEKSGSFFPCLDTKFKPLPVQGDLAQWSLKWGAFQPWKTLN